MKIRCNSWLTPYVQGSDPTEAELPRDLTWLRTTKISRNGKLFFLAKYCPKGEGPMKYPFGMDETGIECVQNKFHFESANIRSAVAISLEIFSIVNTLWENANPKVPGSICQIVGIDRNDRDDEPASANYRLHLVRQGQEWLSSDLEAYEAGILVCD